MSRTDAIEFFQVVACGARVERRVAVTAVEGMFRPEYFRIARISSLSFGCKCDSRPTSHLALGMLVVQMEQLDGQDNPWSALIHGHQGAAGGCGKAWAQSFVRTRHSLNVPELQRVEARKQCGFSWV